MTFGILMMQPWSVGSLASLQKVQHTHTHTRTHTRTHARTHTHVHTLTFAVMVASATSASHWSCHPPPPLGAVGVHNAYFGAGSGHIFLDNSGCSLENDSQLIECFDSEDFIASHNCVHDEDAGAICQSKYHILQSVYTWIVGLLIL